MYNTLGIIGLYQGICEVMGGPQSSPVITLRSTCSDRFEHFRSLGQRCLVWYHRDIHSHRDYGDIDGFKWFFLIYGRDHNEI